MAAGRAGGRPPDGTAPRADAQPPWAEPLPTQMERLPQAKLRNCRRIPEVGRTNACCTGMTCSTDSRPRPSWFSFTVAEALPRCPLEPSPPPGTCASTAESTGHLPRVRCARTAESGKMLRPEGCPPQSKRRGDHMQERGALGAPQGCRGAAWGLPFLSLPRSHWPGQRLLPIQ